MNEFELIGQLIPLLPGNAHVVRGAGDDCALLDIGLPDRLLLFKTDAVVEGVHFTADAPPEKIGRKALARVLSDVAAMGGQPTAALVTIALPKDFQPERVLAIYEGLNALAREHQVAVVGGETTSNPERLLISVALIGFVAKGKAILRSGAMVGDAIFVTGELGGSGQGRHFDFEPRLAEARWLADNFEVRAMLDLSDGLAGDLRHLLQSGKVGAELFSPAIPISAAAKAQARAGSAAKPALLAALSDGEDFELLFTVSAKKSVPLLDAWKARFPSLRLSCIGKIIAQPGLHLRDREGIRPLLAHGYTHFEKH